jgi:uncharacterized protein (DUF433 family)
MKSACSSHAARGAEVTSNRKSKAMTEEELLDRITVDPMIFGGKPIIRGMRIAVEHVLGMLAAGDTPQRLLEEYPLTGTGRHSGLPGLRTPVLGR